MVGDRDVRATTHVVPPRQRVLDTATQLFTEQGFAATSVRQIANRAGVSLDTIYARGSKAEIFLEAIELVLSGRDDGAPLLQAPGMELVWQSETLEEIVTGLVEATVRSTERSAGLWSAFHEGARSDPTLAAALVTKNDAMRAEGRRAVGFFVERGLCRRDIEIDRVADLIWAEAHPDRYALLVGLAGWTVEEFQVQLVGSVLGLLRDPA